MSLFSKQQPDLTSPLIFLSAGEVSGDIYGADLIQELRVQAPVCRFVGMGGPRMQAAGMSLLANPLAYSAVGLSENLAGLPWFWSLFKRMQRWLQQVRPQVVVLIDFQGLNLRLAQVAKSLGIPVVYYIAPQDWLWGMPQAADRLVQLTDLILAVFEPEYHYYQARGARVVQVKHPLLTLLPQHSQAQARVELGLSASESVISLMPGSRQREVDRLWPVLAEVASALQAQTELVFLLPVADPFLKLPPPPQGVRILSADQRYNAMLASNLIVGASGNMVLEAALLGVPVIALYKVSNITYWAAKHLLKVKHITLPNILLQQRIVPEFVQNLELESLLNAVRDLLDRPQSQLQPLKTLHSLLEPTGMAEQTASLILAEMVTRTGV
jgi:lipid-A-disaccharide synthase